jgi:hypothetical protein
MPAVCPGFVSGAVGFCRFAAHVLDREQHLLAVRAHPIDHDQRDRRRPAIEPDANHGAVEDEPHDRLRRQRAGDITAAYARTPTALTLHSAPK